MNTRVKGVAIFLASSVFAGALTLSMVAQPATRAQHLRNLLGSRSPPNRR